MKWITEKISYYRHKNYTTILISTKIEPWQQGLLLGWLCIWAVIGIGILYILLGDNYTESMLKSTNKEKLQLYLILFLVFWGYFLYKIARVYWWRKSGVEFIKIEETKITYKKAFGKYGTAKEYLYENITPIQLIDRPEKSFASVMQSSFWDIGNQTVSFKHFDQEIIFGMQLDPKGAKKIKDFLNKEIKLISNKYT